MTDYLKINQKKRKRPIQKKNERNRKRETKLMTPAIYVRYVLHTVLGLIDVNF